MLEMDLRIYLHKKDLTNRGRERGLGLGDLLFGYSFLLLF